jgi:hypothetical protein
MMNDPKPVFLGFNRKQLQEGIDLVKPKPNWKMPISKVIPRDKINVVDAAIGFFCGGGAEFFDVKDANKVRVVAPGYYMQIGS